MDRQLKYDRITTTIKPETLTIKTNDLSPFKFTLTDEDIKDYKKLENLMMDIANENIGKKVTVKYSKRVGLYSTGRCNQGPIESIKLAEN